MTVPIPAVDSMVVRPVEMEEAEVTVAEVPTKYGLLI